MGTVTAYRGRFALALILGMAAVAVFVALGLVASPANASTDFTICSACHSKDAIHAVAAHSSTGCSTCHASGTAVPPNPSACASCHGGSAAAVITASSSHTTCYGSGCHAAPAPTQVATKAVLKVSPTTLKLHKTVKLTGTVTTATAAKITLLVQFKSGSKWKTAKSYPAAVKSGKFSWTYKPGKKGTYRASGSFKAAATYKAAKTKVITFKVK